MSAKKHPQQPIVKVEGTYRYKQNAIVRYLLEQGPFTLNTIAMLPFSVDDRRQFAKLIGYSLNGYHELNYAERNAPWPPELKPRTRRKAAR